MQDKKALASLILHKAAQVLFEGCNATYTEIEHDASIDALVSRIPYIGSTIA